MWGDLLQAGLGLFGQKTSSDAASQAAQAQVTAAGIAAEAAKFKPYGVTTGFGSSFFDPKAQTAGYTLDPALAAYRDKLMGGAASTMPTNFDPMANAQQYYNEAQTMMDPMRQQQQTQLQQNLFGSGRLGMRLAGEGAGAGVGGGMYQPDVLGFNKAQELANQKLMMDARTQSMSELDKAIARSQGLFTSGMGVEELGLKSLGLGAELGGKASSAGSNAGQMLITGAANAGNANMQAASGWGDYLTGLGSQLGQMKWGG